MKILLLLFFLVSFLFSNQKEIITWLVNDAPPFYINNGELKGSGFGDLIQKQIIKDMNNFEHNIEYTTLKRAMKDFEYKKNVCFSTWIFNSTPDLTITSIPNIYYAPLGVITTKENQEKIGKTIINLKTLLSDTTYKFGIGKGRGYDKPIGTIIEEFKDKPNFIVRDSSNDLTNGLFEMIKRGRIDYTIDYYSSLNYYEIINKNRTNLVFIPIEEVLNKGTLGAIACSKTPWGENVIKQINKSIQKLRTTYSYKTILNEWLVPVDNQQLYWNNYEKYVEKYSEK